MPTTRSIQSEAWAPTWEPGGDVAGGAPRPLNDCRTGQRRRTIEPIVMSSRSRGPRAVSRSAGVVARSDGPTARRRIDAEIGGTEHRAMHRSFDALPKIGASATRAWNNVGYTTLRQLAGVPRAQLAELHGMGPKALGIIEAAVEHHKPSPRLIGRFPPGPSVDARSNSRASAPVGLGTVGGVRVHRGRRLSTSDLGVLICR